LTYKICGLVLSLLLLFGVMFPLAIPRAKSAGNTITVPEDFPTIQEAINNANSGDRVYVRAGTYYENIEVNKTVSLIGENAQNTIIDGGGRFANVIHVSANYVDIKGFTVQNSYGTTGVINAGIALDDVNACTVEGNMLQMNYWCAIYFTGYNNRIMGNNLTKNPMLGIAGGQSVNGSIIGNYINGCEWGIEIEGSGIIVFGNNVYGNEMGIFMGSAYDDDIVGNNVEVCQYGFDIANSTQNYIVNNSITECFEYAFCFEYGSGNNTIGGNDITNNNCLVYSRAANSSNYNIFFQNKFINDAVKISGPLGSSIEIWDNGYYFGGNYWDDYTGKDVYSGPYQNETGSDGIGDTPYIIDANNTDHYPFTIHDVAVSNAATPKTIVGKGYTISINTTIQNIGNYDETFNVTIYANDTTIYQTQITLTAKNATTLTLQCNSTSLPYGNYTLCASASTVPNETDTSDNNYTCSFPIHLGVPGDISSSTTGVYDGRVNMRDIATIVNFFSTKPNSPNWNPNADINNDGTVNMKDIAMAVAHFNQHE
jgi:parallel beta-helix repeat protein